MGWFLALTHSFFVGHSAANISCYIKQEKRWKKKIKTTLKSIPKLLLKIAEWGFHTKSATQQPSDDSCNSSVFFFPKWKKSMLVKTQQEFGVASSQISFLLLIHHFLASCLSVTPEDWAQQELRHKSSVRPCLTLTLLSLHWTCTSCFSAFITPQVTDLSLVSKYQGSWKEGKAHFITFIKPPHWMLAIYRYVTFSQAIMPTHFFYVFPSLPRYVF